MAGGIGISPPDNIEAQGGTAIGTIALTGALSKVIDPEMAKQTQKSRESIASFK